MQVLDPLRYLPGPPARAAPQLRADNTRSVWRKVPGTGPMVPPGSRAPAGAAPCVGACAAAASSPELLLPQLPPVSFSLPQQAPSTRPALPLPSGRPLLTPPQGRASLARVPPAWTRGQVRLSRARALWPAPGRLAAPRSSLLRLLHQQTSDLLPTAALGRDRRSSSPRGLPSLCCLSLAEGAGKGPDWPPQGPSCRGHSRRTVSYVSSKRGGAGKTQVSFV